jgi:hypothetical protein
MGSGSQKVTQTNTVQLSPEQQQLLSQGMGLTQGTVDNPPTLPTPAGFTPEQVAGQDAITQSASAGGQLANTTDKLASAQNFLLGDVLDVNNNPALQGAIQSALDPMRQEFLTKVRPGVDHSSIGTGAFSSYGGSASTLANNLADQTYFRQIGNTTSDIVNNAYNSGLSAMTQGVLAAPNTQRGLLLPGAALDAVGQQKQAQQNLVSQRGFENEMLPFNLGLQLMGAAGGIPGGGSTGTVSTPGQSPLQQILGTAISVLPFL